MKQVFMHRGQVEVEEVPAPYLNDDSILVEVAYSLISTGTETANLASSGKSVLSLALNRPEEIKKILSSIKIRGLLKTFETIKGRLSELTPIGYSCSGRVAKVGKNVNDIKTGDMVACGGASIANHAEVVAVPRNLAVHVPENLYAKFASFATIGAIAMQCLRRAGINLGDTVAILGLGLVGQITSQLAKAAGCKVFGADVDVQRVKMARDLGLAAGCVSTEEDPVIAATVFSKGLGVDAVIITAATQDSTIIQQAMKMVRKKGKVIIVGDVGMQIKRSPFYEKEIDLLISCSYGPGRYDENYEKKNIDYPFAYVRWTENRNMEEFVRLLSQKAVNVDALIGKEYPVTQAEEAYRCLQSEDHPLAVLFKFDVGEDNKEKWATIITVRAPDIAKIGSLPIRLAVIGAGSFAKAVHLPNIIRLKDLFNLDTVVCSSSAHALNTARMFGAARASTDYAEVLKDPDITAVLISTRHNTHAKLALEALQRGKHVFVEKPLATTQDDLDLLTGEINKKDSQLVLCVGYNRRFSPASVILKKALDTRQGPVLVSYRINADKLPPEHWIYSEEGGGRIIGEACHMFDFFNFLVGTKIVEVTAKSFGQGLSRRDNFVVNIKYADDSFCSLTYTAQGSEKLSKEYIEVHWDGKSAIIDDFRSLRFIGCNNPGWRSSIQDKGHRQIFEAFGFAIVGKNPMPFDVKELISVTNISFSINESQV